MKNTLRAENVRRRKVSILSVMYSATALLVITSLFMGCAANQRTPVAAPPVAQQQASFVGEWVISNYQERGTLTLKHDGEAVRISERNGIYYIQSPDWFFNEAKFRLAKANLLIGQSVQDYNGLKEMFPDAPDIAVSQAAASQSAVYKGSLTMTKDGRIMAERSKLKLNYRLSDGRFHSTESFPGWIKFTLVRKK